MQVHSKPTVLLHRLFFIELLLITVFGSLAAWRGQDLWLQVNSVIGGIACLFAGRCLLQPSTAPWRGAVLFATAWIIFPMFKAIRIAWISTTYDLPLLTLDRLLWGGRSLPEIAAALEHPWLSECLSAGYMAYYLVVLLPVAWAVIKRLSIEAQCFLNGIVLMYLLGFAGYLLVPASGPYHAFPETFPYPPQGGAVTALLVALVTERITGMDVFPSLHTGVTTFVWGFFLLGGYRFATLLLTPILLSIVVATVYLRYHYGIDLLAGLLLAAIVLAVIQRQRYRATAAIPVPRSIGLR